MTRHAMRSVTALALVSLVALAAASDAWARAGGGGSRGSRSYSAPARPAPASPATPSSPSRQLDQPGQRQMTPPGPRSGLFGGLMGGLAGFALGGLLGGLLFGGLGHGFGFGLLDMLLIGAGIMLLVSFLRRRQAQSQPAYAGAGAGPAGYDAGASARAVEVEMPAAPSDLERGVGHIRTMDAGFDPQALAADARRVFMDVQGAIMRRELSAVRDRLEPDILTTLQRQCDRLRDARQTNRVEQITIERADVSEAWQERGQDWATVFVAASLVDYTVDDTSGRVIDGSPDRRQQIEEFWTFTRPVGDHPWKLSAIQSS